MTSRTATLALLAAVALGGCRADPGDDQRTETITPESMEQARANWPDGLGAVIDSGNAAYSAQNYADAARLYRRATDIGPQITAGWFGLYMAEQARGNIVAADSAMQRAQQLAPGATLIHTTPNDTGLRSPH
jgi:tetratricopeptide (TPR) repeat protein